MHKLGGKAEGEADPPHWAESLTWGSIPGPCDLDLSQKQMLNLLNHQRYTLKSTYWKFYTKTWFYFFKMILHSILWENLTTLRDPLDEAKWLSRKERDRCSTRHWGTSSSQQVYNSTYAPQHVKMWPLKPSSLAWKGVGHLFSWGNAFAKSLLFSDTTLWVPGKRQCEAFLCCRRKWANQAARLECKPHSGKDFLPNPGWKSRLHVASKNLRKWYKLKSQHFVSAHRFLVTLKCSEKPYLSQIRRSPAKRASKERNMDMSTQAFLLTTYLRVILK